MLTAPEGSPSCGQLVPRANLKPASQASRFPQGRKSQDISYLDGTRHGVLVWNKVSVKWIPEGLKMRKGGPLTNREKRGRNQYENAFLQKSEVVEDHLKLLFPLGRSSRDPTL